VVFKESFSVVIHRKEGIVGNSFAKEKKENLLQFQVPLFKLKKLFLLIQAKV